MRPDSARLSGGGLVSRALIVLGLICLAIYALALAQTAMYQRKAKAQIDDIALEYDVKTEKVMFKITKGRFLTETISPEKPLEWESQTFSFPGQHRRPRTIVSLKPRK